MSALSFVALSLQTTHLDPATVSKASYVKLVDGNITRLDAIPVIPPTSQSHANPEDLEVQTGGQITWGDALSQLSMMIGKLPIVSYYRDADKEIFQAASRKVDAPLPPFQWLDCRALARELLPDLPEYQLSTVLKALDLYQDHADSTMVEQTAQIVLELADRQGATTVLELWGDLYDQPDEILGLEATLEGLAWSEPTRGESAETSPSNGATGPAVPPVAGVPGLTQLSGPEIQNTQTQLPDEPSVESSDGVENEIGAASEETAETTQAVAAAEGDREWPGASQRLYEDAASDTAPEEEQITEDNGGSTAQSVLDDQSLEQPEFLKVPLRDEPAEVAFEHESVSEKHDDAVNPPSEDAAVALTANETVEDEPTLIPDETDPVAHGVAASPEPSVEDTDAHPPESSSGSTARSVRESENLGQPEFLKLQLDDEAHEDIDEEQIETATPADGLVGNTVAQPGNPESDPVQPAEPVSLQEPVEEETTPGNAVLGDLTNDDKDADLDEPSTTPEVEEAHDYATPALADTPDPNHDATEQHVADAPAQAKPFQPVDQVVTPTTPSVTGLDSTRTVATTPYVEVRDKDRTTDDGYGTSSSRSGRVLGLLGMLIFGMLTVVGLTLTVLATLLFFTTNNLLLETKIAGVVLTAAITLLSLLMTTLSYRSFRRR